MKRTIEVSTTGISLKSKSKSLILSLGHEQLGKVPFEDLGVLILDSTAINITTGAICSTLNNGASIIFCDDKHLPAGILVPLENNSTYCERVHAQISAQRPLHKNIWRRVVKSKILCQAELLNDSPAKNRLNRLAKDVKSGDKENYEAQAAKVYWSEYFGKHFRRDRSEEKVNALLNYGYIVLRSAMARALCSAGLLPVVGIHHHSKYNPFCLADDLMEPYRPWVDARVKAIIDSGEEGVHPGTKRILLKFLTDTVFINNEKSPLAIALERTASSLASIYLNAHSEECTETPRQLASGLILPSPTNLKHNGNFSL